VAGAILPAPLCEDATLVAALRAEGIAVVTIAPGRAHADTLCVRIDEYAAAHELTRHLLALGHRRIGFIRGNPNESASEERWHGFEAALRGAGIDTSKVHVEQGFCTYRSGHEAARTLLSMGRVPTAIVASNDDMAAAVIAEAHRRRIDVPGSLSVVGFGDSPAACNIWPELTTIRQPVTEMATEAVNLLIEAIRSARSDRQPQDPCRVLSHTLVVRGSTSTAPVEQ
jgi:LacI family transcriptional regulator